MSRDPDQIVQNVDVSTDFHRTCAKCRRRAWAEPLSFKVVDADEKVFDRTARSVDRREWEAAIARGKPPLGKVFEVDVARFPPGWSHFAAYPAGGASLMVDICGDCTAEVLRFLGVESA